MRAAQETPVAAGETADRALRDSGRALVAVGALFLVLQHLVLRRWLGLSIDEANYLAKVNPAVPELIWTEVRAWGVPVLAAPVAIFSPGTAAVRVYFSVLSSAGLVAAFWPWRRVLHPAVAPLAALLFATTWFTLAFGPQVMPNLYVALGAVATAGLLLRAVGDGGWAPTVAVGGAAGFLALVRPTDSTLVLAPMLGWVLLVPRLRRLRVVAAVVVGAALGWVPWVVEAYTRFDGPLDRLRGGNSTGLRGGVSLNLTNLQTYPRMLDGSPTYCCYGGPASEAGAIPVLHTLWFVAIPVLAFLGMVAAARLGRLPEIMVAAAPAGLLATFYVFFLTFAGLRFLLPIVALLSLPVATGLVEVVTRTAPRRRAVAAGVVAVLVTGHVGLMIGTATIRLPILADRRDRDVRIAEAVRPLMTSRPCVVIGEQPQVRSYYLGCRVQGLRGTAQPPARVTSALQEGGSVIAVLSKPPPRRSYLSSWRAVPLPQVGPRWVAYLPPGSGIGG